MRERSGGDSVPSSSLSTFLFAVIGAFAAAAAVPGCSGDEANQSAPQTGGASATFVTDSAVEPRGELGENRSEWTIATVVDPNGAQMDFLENEVVVLGTKTEARDIAERHDGRVVSTTEYPTHPDQHLVRLGEPTADRDAIARNITAANRELAPERDAEPVEGEFRASSDAALATLAVAAEESAQGTIVTPNVVAYPAIENYLEHDLTEGSGAGNSPNGYDPNPFEWDNFSVLPAPRTGITEAWRLLAIGGHVDPPAHQRVPVGIIDGGFDESPDRPPGSVGPLDEEGEDVTGTENATPCSNGSECPWHGHNVTDVAVGMVDNGIGAAGAGGPVGRALMFHTDVGFYASASAIEQASNAGARVINTSFTIGLIWPFQPLSSEPIRNAVESVSGESLVVAAAGNDGQDVNGQTPFLAPCQIDDVLCVGGTGFSSKSHHPDSNYGEDVVLWAPFESFFGPDPDHPGGNTVQRTGGTSISAPIVVGVAALVWKVDPWRTPEEVRSVLMSTARPGLGFAGPNIDAAAAVSEVLDLDFDPDEVDFPTVQITKPGPETSFLPGTTAGAAPASTAGPPPVFARADIDIPISSGTVHWMLNGETEAVDYAPQGTSQAGHTFDDVCIPEQGVPTIRIEVEGDQFGLSSSDTVELTVDEGGYRVSADIEAEGVSIQFEDGYYYVPVVDTQNAQYDYEVPQVTLRGNEWTRTCEGLPALDESGFDWGLVESNQGDFGAEFTLSDFSFRNDDDTLGTRTVTLSHESTDVSTIIPVSPCDPQYGPDADLVDCPDAFSTSGVAVATREIYRQISEFDDIRRAREFLDARLDELLGDALPDPFPHGEMQLRNELSDHARQVAGPLLNLRTAAEARDLEQWYSESARIVREATATRTEGAARLVARASRLTALQLHRYTPEAYGGAGGWYRLAPFGPLPQQNSDSAFEPAIAALDGFLTALLVLRDGQIYDGAPTRNLEIALETGVVTGALRALAVIDTERRQ